MAPIAGSGMEAVVAVLDPAAACSLRRRLPSFLSHGVLHQGVPLLLYPATARWAPSLGAGSGGRV